MRRRAAVIAAVAAGVALTASACSWRTPALSATGPQPQTTRIYAADGSLLTSLHADEDRELVAFAQLPRVLVDAVVDIEDERFWQHSGVDLKATIRAARRDANRGETVEGGSTITQQYVKNVLVGNDRTLKRKITEATQAWELERRSTKERILELYLNSIYFGNGAYGVQAASRTYFGVTVDKLDLGQAALLAGVIQSPNATDPFLHPDAALARRNVVLGRMADLGSIPRSEVTSTTANPLGLRTRAADERYPAPFFVEQVKRFVLDDPRFGSTPEARRDLLFRGGLRISTTLEPARQQAAEQAVAAVLTDPARMPDAAVVAVEPSTGFVRALVGGRDFFGTGGQAKFDLAVQGHREAGSSFKPFVLAAALEDGIPLTKTYPAPSHIDIPLPPPANPPVWPVDNAENEAGGTLDLVEATVHSVNTVYAQLIMDVGPPKAIAMANRLGIESKLQPYPSAVLGTNDVSPLEMAGAYATLANGGVRVPTTFVTRVTRADGTVVYEQVHGQRRVLDAGIAATETQVLEQVVTRGTGRAAAIDRPVAGKTGTGEDFRNAWFVGYSPDLATAVWVGYPDRQRSMVPPATPIDVFGGTWPTQIWHGFMAAALHGLPITTFPDQAAAGDPLTGAAAPTTTTTAVAPPAVLVSAPAVVGLQEQDAVAAVRAVGLEPLIDAVPDDASAVGMVLSESPAAGTALAAGSAVRVRVSSGSASVVVPDLLGRQADDARAAVAAAGLTSEVVVQEEPAGAGPRRGQVWKQDPTPASRRARGSSVTITVNPPSG